MTPTSVYVHFPWCARKCPYCDFATRGLPIAKVPHDAYADALLRELGRREAQLDGRKLESVFFGGGTPSMWRPEALGRVLRAIRGAFGRERDALEITVECNPQSFDAGYAAALREQGVNRVSLGIQSLDDERLQFLGRLHDRKGALRALDAARTQFSRVNTDFMFGMPGQDVPALRDGLREVLDRGIKHVSAYALTIEPDTPFGRQHAEGTLEVADDDTYAALFADAETLLADYGVDHYEVSAYGAGGHRSVHNQHYWRGGAYLGLGAAAVGCLDEGVGHARRYRNEPDARRYMAAETLDATEENHEDLDAEAILREALMLGLRTLEGVDIAATEARAGRALAEGRQAALRRHTERGNLSQQNGRLRVPRERWIQLDGIIADLF